MKININISDELLKRIDEKAKSLYISRSAYISTALCSKLQQDEMMDSLPEIMTAYKQAIAMQAIEKVQETETETEK